MPVHFGQPRHQILAVASHAQRALRDLYFPGCADLGDASVPDDNSLVIEHALAVHRDDINVVKNHHLVVGARRPTAHSRGQDRYKKQLAHIFPLTWQRSRGAYLAQTRQVTAATDEARSRSRPHEISLRMTAPLLWGRSNRPCTSKPSGSKRIGCLRSIA